MIKRNDRFRTAFGSLPSVLDSPKMRFPSQVMRFKQFLAARQPIKYFVRPTSCFLKNKHLTEFFQMYFVESDFRGNKCPLLNVGSAITRFFFTS